MKTILHRRKYSYSVAVRIVVMTAILALVPALQSCDALNGYDFDKSKFKPGDALPDNRELITESDAVGSYSGQIYLKMDGKKYGPFTETIDIKKDIYGKYFLKASKVDYGSSMPVNISYSFNTLSLTPATDGKSIAFAGENGEVRYYDKAAQSNETGLLAGKKTVINGNIFKINGKVYIAYTTVYDTAEMKEFIPLLKDLPGHNDMSGTAAKSAKQ